MEGNNVDSRPIPIVELPQTREYAQLLPKSSVEHSLVCLVVDVTNVQSLMDKLNKMLVSNINKHHQKTIHSYFHTV